LKENIGASELTYRAGTKWILEVIGEVSSQTPLEIWKDASRLRNLLRNEAINSPIETSDSGVEILTAASGKALLLTQDPETAQKIIQSVTQKALIEAPGLTVSGVYVAVEDWPLVGSLATAVKAVHQKFEHARSHLPAPTGRFLRLPIIADCSASGLPASQLEQISAAQAKEGGQARPISQVSDVKRKASREAKDRLTHLDEHLAVQIGQLLEEESETDQKSWLAIVHADGNGLGQIFLNFEKYIGDDQSSRNYIRRYREFSLALDECTEAAF
jgi:hypothetical protein